MDLSQAVSIIDRARASRKPAKSLAKQPAASVATVDASERNRHIAEAAYYLAERRGFAPGQEISDWLQAEAMFDQRQH